MSVIRQANILGQQRLDVPHVRAIESSIAADFDVLAGRVMGGSKALVIRGFTLTNTAAGTASATIQLVTADSILFNVNATESGTFLWVPSDRTAETLNSATNPRVDGSFTAGQVNYVGLDLTRSADDSTSDLVQFLDANTKLENPKNVPLARTLDYRIVISTVPFSSTPNIIPIAKITTDSQNQVATGTSSVEDARNLMYRLATGGDFPARYASFTWPTSRIEQDPAISGLSTLDRFSGGDKDIHSQKDWMDAVMSRIWEIGGGQNWYSATADRNLKVVGLPSPSVFTSTSDNFEWGIESGVPANGLYSVQHLHWQGLRILFENANVTGVYYNVVADQTSDDVGTPASSTGSKTALAVGDCIYVDIDRTSNATVVAKKAALQSLGSPATPGSRVILAWRTADGVFRRDSQNPVNTSYTVATTGAVGSVRLAYAAATPATPTVAPLGANNTMTLGSGTYAIVGNNPTLALTGNGDFTTYALTIVSTAGTGRSLSISGGAIGAVIQTTNVGIQIDNHLAVGPHVAGIIASGRGNLSGVVARSLNGTALTAQADPLSGANSVNGANISGAISGYGATITAGGNAGSYGLIVDGSSAGHGLKVTATDTSALAAEVIGANSTTDALKVTTGILRVRTIEDTAAGNMAIGTDSAKTHVVNIGNTGNGVNLYGPTFINGATEARGAITIPDAYTAGITIPAGYDYGYNTTKTLKKVIAGTGFVGFVASGSFTLLYEGPSVSSGSRIGKGGSGGGGDSYKANAQFGLPKGAVITGMTAKLTHAGSATTSATIYVYKQRPAASGTEWTSSNCLASSTITLGAGAATGTDFALSLTGTTADRTVSQTDEIFTVEYVGAGTGYNYLISLAITYTITNLLPDNA